jgi:hypothetical protein
MDFETVISECKRLVTLLKEKLPSNTYLDLDIDAEYDVVYIYVGPGIYIRYDDEDKFDVETGPSHDRTEKKGRYLTVEETLNAVIQLTKSMEYYVSKYKIDELESKIKTSIELEKRQLDLIIKLLAHSDKSSNHGINKSINELDEDYLHRLQNYCVEILSNAIDYEPSSDTVDDLRKDFESLSTQHKFIKN